MILEGSHNIIGVEKGGVYSRREGYILGGSHIVVEKGVYFEREGYILGGSHNNAFVEKGVIFWEG